MSGSWVPRRRSEVSWREIDGDIVILRSDVHASYLLTASGALLWQVFDGASSIEEVAEDVATAFGAALASVRADIEVFAAELEGLGLLEERSGDASVA